MQNEASYVRLLSNFVERYYDEKIDSVLMEEAIALLQSYQIRTPNNIAISSEVKELIERKQAIAEEMAEKLKYWYEYGDRADDPNLKKSPVFLTELEALRALEYDFEARSAAYFKMFRPEVQP